MKIKAKSFTIDRLLWAQGRWSGYANKMLNSNGTMCCLGFYMKACGLKNKDIYGIGMPSSLDNIPSEANWLITKTYIDYDQDKYGKAIQANIANINDQCGIAYARKEKQIARLFKEYGDVDVLFVGKYPSK